MSQAAEKKSEHAGHVPRPVIKKIRWPWFLVWLAPVLALALAGYYFYERAQDRGPEITVRFSDATGLKPGESQVAHLGVQIGQVTRVELTPDKKNTLVHIQLHRAESSFAKSGAQFWIVRPEISTQEISGLATVLSGPIINGLPGTGEMQKEFTGLEKPPVPPREGLHILLKTPHLQRLQPNSPIYFRDIQVGFIQEIQLGSDSTTVDIRALIQPRYAPLVKANSQFWVVSAVDLKGSVFTGIQVKVESLRSLLSGGIAFATPEEKMGDQAENGATFVLHEDSKKEWLAWSPKISIEPDDNGRGDEHPDPPQPRPDTGSSSSSGSN